MYNHKSSLSHILCWCHLPHPSRLMSSKVTACRDVGARSRPHSIVKYTLLLALGTESNLGRESWLKKARMLVSRVHTFQRMLCELKPLIILLVSCRIGKGSRIRAEQVGLCSVSPIYLRLWKSGRKQRTSHRRTGVGQYHRSTHHFSSPSSQTFIQTYSHRVYHNTLRHHCLASSGQCCYNISLSASSNHCKASTTYSSIASTSSYHQNPSSSAS